MSGVGGLANSHLDLAVIERKGDFQICCKCHYGVVAGGAPTYCALSVV